MWGGGGMLEGIGFKPWNFSTYLILPAALGPRYYSASSRNKYQKQKKNVSGDQSMAGV
jgi:hypothetical protein